MDEVRAVPAPGDHPGLAWLRETEAGRDWIDALPGLVDACARRWSLTLGEPFGHAYVSVAMPARLPDGTDAVLKVGLPHRESAHEGAALAHWGGVGAVRLLAEDPDRHALLLERCLPGAPLSDVDPTGALDVLTGLLPRLLVPAGPPFRALADEAAGWLAGLPRAYEQAGRPFERRLLDAAADVLTALPGSQGPPVLLNQDLHARNVLRARREPWLVIDPKPLAGEREFAVAPVVRDAALGHGRAAVLRRLDRLCGELGLDRERALGWTVASTLAWAFEGDTVLPDHVDVVRWLLGGA